MVLPSIRWLCRIAITIAVIVAAVALLWAVWWLWSLFSPSWNSRTVMAIAIIALVLLAAIWWLWWWLPKRQIARLALQIRDPKARADTEDNFRKTIGQVLGGAAVLIGATVAYLQFSQEQQAARERLISEQVSKGFEHLGNKDTRLGGIYGLEGVMNTSEQYRVPVLEALCAFVREGTKGEVKGKPATEIQATLTVIGRRHAVGPEWLDLGAANIEGANLFEANLTRAYLRGANLTGADLEGANLTGSFMEDAILTGATLANADLSYVKALTQAQLDQACGTPRELPKGLNAPKPCPKPMPIAPALTPPATPP